MANHDLTGVRRGNSFSRTFRFKDGDAQPVDLLGSVLMFVVKADQLLLIKSTADGSLDMPDPATGEMTLTLTPAETRLFPVGRLRTRYEIERRIGAEEVTLAAGFLIVEEGINQDA